MRKKNRDPTDLRYACGNRSTRVLQALLEWPTRVLQALSEGSTRVLQALLRGPRWHRVYWVLILIG